MLWCATKLFSYQALVIEPVVDAFGASYEMRSALSDRSLWYSSLPYAPGKDTLEACPRLHQLLFHERVEVLKTTDHEALVEVSTAFYVTRASSSPQTRYWVAKDSLLPMVALADQDHLRIPPPLDYRHPLSLHTGTIVTLIQPWYDSTLGVTFSVGTRFIKAEEQATKNGAPIVWRINPLTHVLEKIIIKSAYCIHNNNRTQDESINTFVALARSWTTHPDNKTIIPYVLGGTSFTGHIPNVPFTLEPMSFNPSLHGYVRKKHTEQPKCGFDCSGLVLRAAQLAGIPYFAKNTTTITHQLLPVRAGEAIRNGDLIVLHGHVMIISDPQNNMIIEARGYKDGYGCVHEATIDTIFQGIPTIAALQKAYESHIPVQRIDYQGSKSELFPFITIMRMASAWEKS
jgi:hypothetical protein